MQINQKLIDYNYSSRQNQTISYLVIHDTGNSRPGADAKAHYHYFNAGNRSASAHYFVDDTQILQLVEDHHASWHCGDGRGRYGITNSNSIGIEICINSDGNYAKAVEQTIKLTAYLAEKYTIPHNKIVRHYDVSRKICPGTMSRDNWALWYELKDDVLALRKQNSHSEDASGKLNSQSEVEPETNNLKRSIQILTEAGIINSPEYWDQHARKGETIKGQYAAFLIERVAQKLKTK
ncbi:peptidoglycan recognition protein family protein [Natranaerobius thermophilus]|uniref:N-acetylmuramoyl-L-alanine amidase n=1 Tax=Natranaerobius thermophilus (strain ATCC BAA-1301 / DSM 18059 / JW/NM-WN-LF) TaxID=457570 RepID=B2A1Q6_NATTJ|nr:peptidoglycan recognition family protein [Natranaerobius thermophilus]ACB86103.1 N-acetylmuramoyl-L-alanine amidase family 2 [Natranaerobius thermophilus JW/NM-WN-LF]